MPQTLCDQNIFDKLTFTVFKKTLPFNHITFLVHVLHITQEHITTI